MWTYWSSWSNSRRIIVSAVIAAVVYPVGLTAYWSLISWFNCGSSRTGWKHRRTLNFTSSRHSIEVTAVVQTYRYESQSKSVNTNHNSNQLKCSKKSRSQSSLRTNFQTWTSIKISQHNHNSYTLRNHVHNLTLDLGVVFFYQELCICLSKAFETVLNAGFGLKLGISGERYTS